MKTLCISTSIIILAFNFNTTSGKIQNGYSSGISGAIESLKSLNTLLLDERSMTSAEKKIVESRIKEVETFIVYYELTETLLSRFRLVAPSLYNEIDTLKDRMGRTTDVFVKFIPEEQARVQAWGITNIAQVKGDPDAYLSEYGERAVSVKIWVVNKSLLVLAHELGHVKYQVADLANYFDYYKSTYRRGVTDPNNIGHDHNDPSGKNAVLFEKGFRESQASYFKNSNSPGRSPVELRKSFESKFSQFR
jgi:hypothetical protein